MLKGKRRYHTINLTYQEYVSHPTASCCECTTHLQYIYYNSRYFAIDGKVSYRICSNYQRMTVIRVEAKMISST